jgi:uncharacterized DUF497 family protein
MGLDDPGSATAVLDEQAAFPLPVAKSVSHLDVEFEWDDEKARRNVRVHGVSFPEATTTFGDPLALIEDDKAHADRFNLIGISARLRHLFVVYAEKTHGETIRIISARRATAREQRDYEEGKR